MKISKSFEAFAKEASKVQRAWMEFVRTLDQASALDKKTEELASIAVLAAVRLAGGLLFHVKMAKSLGATREEIGSDVLVGLPATGNIVVQALPIVLAAFDEESRDG